MFASYRTGLMVPVRNNFAGYPLVGQVESVSIQSIRAEVARIRKKWPPEQVEYTAGAALRVLKDTLSLMDYLLSAISAAMQHPTIKFNSAATAVLSNNSADLHRILKSRIMPYIPLLKTQAPAAKVTLPSFRKDMLFVYEDIIRKLESIRFIESIEPEIIRLISNLKILELFSGIGRVSEKVKDLAAGAWAGFKWIFWVLLAVGGLALGAFLFRGRGTAIVVR